MSTAPTRQYMFSLVALSRATSSAVSRALTGSPSRDWLLELRDALRSIADERERIGDCMTAECQSAARESAMALWLASAQVDMALERMEASR